MICKHCEADISICGNELNNGGCRFVRTVRNQRNRADNYISRRGSVHEPGTLTAKEWRETLQDFHGCCAYCLEQKPLELEHFIPLGWGAGTVKWNCVPSCHRCNMRKGDQHPALVTTIPQEAIDRVRIYLQQFLYETEIAS